MTTDLQMVVAGLFACVGAVLFVITYVKASKSKMELEKLVLETEKEKEKILSEANRKAQSVLSSLRKDLDKEHQEAMKSLRRKESEVDKRFDLVDRRQEKIRNQELDMTSKIDEIAKKQETIAIAEKEIANLLEQEKLELSRVSGTSPEEAKKLLLQKMEVDVQADAARMVTRLIEEAKEKADRESHKILLNAMPRLVHDTTSEATVSSVTLPDEKIKGKIIGREGRNIRAFEKAAGVDVIIDESPELISLSSFDPIRREISRRAIESLIKDGRIHPQRIEEQVLKFEEEMEEEIKRIGEETILEAGFNDVHSDIMKVFGRLKFRMSYGQNQMEHSLQVMELCDYIATEMNIDRKLARRCGLLHDIGKAVDQGANGTHPALGYDLAKKCGENDIVLNAIAAHHEGVAVESIYTCITSVADAISASRPGARRESTEKYFERMDSLEALASSYKGVNKAYAMRAGRELWVAVEPGIINDKQGMLLAREVAKDIEKQLTYPGEVKVTLIRETRFVEFAR
ncbi:MAG: ribonuclease Y [Planctomycetes bacterium]|nr:ribonuclease Y [Planctomycetota bacterium]